MQEWFESHDECPVAGCTCACAKLDPVAPIVTGKTAAGSGEEAGAAAHAAPHSSVFPNSGGASALLQLKAGWARGGGGSSTVGGGGGGSSAGGSGGSGNAMATYGNGMATSLQSIDLRQFDA